MGRPLPVAAFTLIEVALALLVVGIGLLAAFGLFPTGLGAAKAAGDEARAAAFADDTFAALRAASLHGPWADLGSPSALPPPVADRGLDTRAVPGAGIRPVYLALDRSHYLPTHLPPTLEPDAAFRYRLDVSPGGPRTAVARLLVWPGEFGPSADADAFVFATEFFRHGR